MLSVKVLVTGKGGQVADALLRLKPAGVAVTATARAELDVGDPEAVRSAVAKLKPDLIINGAAYTAVDKAESEPDLALRVNGEGPGHLAQAARENGARFMHLSTDFVFDGQAKQPYRPDSPTAPLGAYGASKLEGERRSLEISQGEALVLRTAWVYAARGHNFVRTMLKLMRERDAVRVVADQVGTPTWASSIAEVLWLAAGHPEARGIYHWTDAGVASWYDFAVAIQEEALIRSLLPRAVNVIPIATHEYPTPARRPAYSVLDSTAAVTVLSAPRRQWRASLRTCLDELAAAGANAT